jgi:uncharacterized repeat protein (TIGR03803 family)
MKISGGWQCLILAGFLVLAAGAPASAGPPPSIAEEVLYGFNSSSSHPYARLIMDGAGNLYGTTAGYSVNSILYDGGGVFKLAPNGAAGWTWTALYHFCPQSDCTTGAAPRAGLIMDGAGNLYGTTPGGGSHNGGTVYRLSPTGTGWSQSVLYSFCSQTSCADGLYPQSELIMDAAGNLYGTTPQGGGSQNSGTVYRLSPTGTGWSHSVLYSFCSQTICTDGGGPIGGLIVGGAGNLYGTTASGGSQNRGAVYRLSPTGSGWSETVLYSFCSQNNCADGQYPASGLIMDGAGNLYATTANGGGQNYGTVYRLSPTSSGWSETVLYSFCSQTSCTDGLGPAAGLIMDGAGNLYGTTESGGSQNHGTVYRLAPTSAGWSETVLYSFCSQTNCSDGDFPLAELIMDGAGNLYGTTYDGGNPYCGHFSPDPAIAVKPPVTFPGWCGTAFRILTALDPARAVGLPPAAVANSGEAVALPPAVISPLPLPPNAF